MPSKKFTFFSIFLGFDLLASFIPGASIFSLGGLPILIIVSGWKYAGLDIFFNELMNLPDVIRQWLTIGSIIPQIWSLRDLNKWQILHLAPSIPYFPNSKSPPAHMAFKPYYLVHSIPAWQTDLIYVAIPLLVFLYGFLTWKSLKRYLKLLRMVRFVARTWHR